MIQTSRLTYRVNQFWRALRTPARVVDTGQISPCLSPSQMALFRQMQPSEQWHASLVVQRAERSRPGSPGLAHGCPAARCGQDPVSAFTVGARRHRAGQEALPAPRLPLGEGNAAGFSSPVHRRGTPRRVGRGPGCPCRRIHHDRQPDPPPPGCAAGKAHSLPKAYSGRSLAVRPAKRG